MCDELRQTHHQLRKNLRYNIVNVDYSEKVVSFEEISEFTTLQRRVTQAEKLEVVGRLMGRLRANLWKQWKKSQVPIL